MEPILISNLREITLDAQGYWVTATDLMGRVYRLEPQAVLGIAIWVAKHHQKVELVRRSEGSTIFFRR